MDDELRPLPPTNLGAEKQDDGVLIMFDIPPLRTDMPLIIPTMIPSKDSNLGEWKGAEVYAECGGEWYKVEIVGE